MKRKFKIGDKVRLTKRAPADIRQKFRHRTRTIILMEYDKKDQCMYYELGSKGKGRLPGFFRSYMMAPAPAERVRGRPREKRKYARKSH